MGSIPVKWLPSETGENGIPLLPTIVFASYKGGVWKTSLSVATAERLALAGLRVLLITSDSQEDARARMGIQSHEPMLAARSYGTGSVSVLAVRGSHAVDLLYRAGTERLGHGRFDVAVVDTPPEINGGRLPGVLMFTPVDGSDAVRNLATMLRQTPANTDVVLVKVGAIDRAVWSDAAESIARAIQRDVDWLDAPLPASAQVEAAQNEGRSVWALPRRGKAMAFLSGINQIASMSYERLRRGASLPPLPTAAGAAPFVRGWDHED